MGLIRTLAKRVVSGLRTPESAPPPAPVPAPPPAPPPAPITQVLSNPEAATAATEGRPWYLEGEEMDPGWDETNPGKEPGKKWDQS